MKTNVLLIWCEYKSPIESCRYAMVDESWLKFDGVIINSINSPKHLQDELRKMIEAGIEAVFTNLSDKPDPSWRYEHVVKCSFIGNSMEFF